MLNNDKKNIYQHKCFKKKTNKKVLCIPQTRYIHFIEQDNLEIR